MGDGTPQGRDSICSGEWGCESVLLCCCIAPANHGRVKKSAPSVPRSRKLFRLAVHRTETLCAVAQPVPCTTSLPGQLPDSLTVPSLLDLEHPITRSSR